MTRLVLRPGVEDRANGAEHLSEVVSLLLQQHPYVAAGRLPAVPLSCHFRDLVQGQAQSAGLGHERERAQDISRVDPVTGVGTPSALKNAALLVEPQRLPREPTTSRHFSYQQISHAESVDPSLYGKVNTYLRSGTGPPPMFAVAQPLHLRMSRASDRMVLTLAPRIREVRARRHRERPRLDAKPLRADSRAHRD